MYTKALLITSVFGFVAIGVLQSSPSSARAETSTTQPVRLPKVDASGPVDLRGLHNVVAYTDDLLCGGVPEGEVAFATLESLGIKTVLSVDGALPEVELAKAHGLRYVHLPIGYNGMDEARMAEIARAVRDLPKPIYVHCHHGKHRSASASAAAAVLLGWLTPDQALSKMKVSGTATIYTGLFDAVRTASTCEKAVVETAPTDFPEQSKPDGLVQAMIEIDEVMDGLKSIDKAGWSVPADHPDLVPVALAGQLADHFRLLLGDRQLASKGADVRSRLELDQKTMEEIESGIVDGLPREQLGAKLKTVIQSCKDCHAAHRDLEPAR